MNWEFHQDFQAANKCSLIIVFFNYIEDFKIFIFTSCFVMWFLIIIKIKFVFMFVCCSWATMLHALSAFMDCVFVVCFVNHVSEGNCQFSSFIHSVETDCKEWFSWNSFIKIDTSFFIIMYNFHVLCSYSSHLIRSSNHVNFMFHFMSSIKLIKYESSVFLTIVSCSNDTCLLIKSSFKSCNKLMWNVEWTFISDDNLSSYTYELIFCLIINCFVNFQLSFFADCFVFRFHVLK